MREWRMRWGIYDIDERRERMGRRRGEMLSGLEPNSLPTLLVSKISRVEYTVRSTLAAGGENAFLALVL
jgi:hypothetical protein